MSGLGGVGLAILWNAAEQKASALDFLGVLPGSLNPGDYPLDPDEPPNLLGYPSVKDRKNMVGPAAMAVPGAVRGLGELHARHGRLPFGDLLQPAIHIAESGIPVDWHAALMIATTMEDLQKYPATAAIYLPDGLPPAPPVALGVPGLAQSFRLLADQGPGSFYSGDLADLVVGDLEAVGSNITAADLAGYQALWFETAEVSHRDAKVHTAGERSGGGRLADTLTYLAGHLDYEAGLHPATAGVYAEALRAAWRQHQLRTGQMDGEDACTTHLSACDRDGNMVALTYTLLNRFGCRVLLPGAGFLMNNAVSYFHPRPGTPLSLAPGARVASCNMCPTLATRDGQALFAVGASGANRIFPAVAQLVSFMLDWGMDIEAALHQPRLDLGPDGIARLNARLGQAALAATAGEAVMVEPTSFPKKFAFASGVEARAGVFSACAEPAHPNAGAAAACDRGIVRAP